MNQSLTRTTEFSPCRKYRYVLWRDWSRGQESFEMFDGTNDGERGNRLMEYAMFICLNPSIADETLDDPTIRRCMGFAKAWGFGALCMTNLFAWRDTKPANMRKAIDPIGAENDTWLRRCADGAGLVIAAWGKNGNFMNRNLHVSAAMPKLHCLRLNSDASPEHPLYIPADTQPVRFP